MANITVRWNSCGQVMSIWNLTDRAARNDSGFDAYPPVAGDALRAKHDEEKCDEYSGTKSESRRGKK